MLIIYKSVDINYEQLYGKGFTYSNLIDSSLHDDSLDNCVEDSIKNKLFDIIIYGSYHRGMPFKNLVDSVYKPEEVILLCGEDIHNCNYREINNLGHHIFIREY